MHFLRELNTQEPFGSERKYNAYQIVPLATGTNAFIS